MRIRVLRAIRPANAGRQTGFTLIEMMVAVAVLAILSAIAVPSFRNMIEQSKVTSAANEILGALQVARNEAIRRNARVDICPTTNGSACGGANWTRFALIARKDGASTLIREVRLSNNLTVRSSTRVATANHVIGFGADGFARVGAEQTGGITACAPTLSGTNAVDVIVSVSRVGTVRRSAGSSCTALQGP